MLGQAPAQGQLAGQCATEVTVVLPASGQAEVGGRAQPAGQLDEAAEHVAILIGLVSGRQALGGLRADVRQAGQHGKFGRKAELAGQERRRITGAAGKCLVTIVQSQCHAQLAGRAEIGQGALGG